MTDHEILLKILEKIETLDSEVKEVKNGIKQLDAKTDRNYEGTVKAIADVVDVIGNKVDKSEKMILSKIHDVESVTAQNAFDVQLMKRKAE